MDQSSIHLTDEQTIDLISSDIDLGAGMEPQLFVRLHHNVREWCSENLKDFVEIEHDTPVDRYGSAYLEVTLHFGSPEDAIYFKLRWL